MMQRVIPNCRRGTLICSIIRTIENNEKMFTCRLVMPKMIKYPGTDWLHFENVFKTNQKYPNNPQLL